MSTHIPIPHPLLPMWSWQSPREKWGPGRTSVTAWPMECSRGDVIWLPMLLMKCDMIFLRHITLKSWVAMLEVGISEAAMAKRLHAGRGRCSNKPSCYKTAVQVFLAQVSDMRVKKPLRDFKLRNLMGDPKPELLSWDAIKFLTHQIVRANKWWLFLIATKFLSG